MSGYDDRDYKDKYHEIKSENDALKRQQNEAIDRAKRLEIQLRKNNIQPAVTVETPVKRATSAPKKQPSAIKTPNVRSSGYAGVSVTKRNKLVITSTRKENQQKQQQQQLFPAQGGHTRSIEDYIDDVQGSDATQLDGKDYFAGMLSSLQSRLADANTGGSGGKAGGEGGGKSGDGGEAGLHYLRQELREKKAKIALLQSHFDHLGAMFRAEKDVQKQAFSQAEEFKRRLKESLQQNRDLKRQIETLEIGQDQVANFQIIMQDMRSENTALQERVKMLTANIFTGDTLEAQRLKTVVTDFTNQIDHLKKEIEQKNVALGLTAEQKAASQDVYAQLTAAHRAKGEVERQLAHHVAKNAVLTERLAVFSSESGVELEDLEAALDLVKRQRENPSKIDFLDSDAVGEHQDTLPSLKRRCHDLEIKLKDMLLEVAQKNDNLTLQRQVNATLQAEKSGYKRHIRSMQLEVQRLTAELQRRPLTNPLADSIFGCSDTESEFGDLVGLENIIAFRVTDARLNTTCPALNGLDSPITFLTCDFYHFESSHSGLFTGFKPEYGFTTQFKVVADSFLTQYLESDRLQLELYLQTPGPNVLKIAQCFISLKGLLMSRAMVEGTAVLIGDNQEEVGTLSFVCRMLRPMVSASPSLVDAIPPYAPLNGGVPVFPSQQQQDEDGGLLTDRSVQHKLHANLDHSFAASFRGDLVGEGGFTEQQRQKPPPPNHAAASRSAVAPPPEHFENFKNFLKSKLNPDGSEMKPTAAETKPMTNNNNFQQIQSNNNNHFETLSPATNSPTYVTLQLTVTSCNVQDVEYDANDLTLYANNTYYRIDQEMDRIREGVRAKNGQMVAGGVKYLLCFKSDEPFLRGTETIYVLLKPPPTTSSGQAKGDRELDRAYLGRVRCSLRPLSDIGADRRGGTLPTFAMPVENGSGDIIGTLTVGVSFTLDKKAPSHYGRAPSVVSHQGLEGFVARPAGELFKPLAPPSEAPSEISGREYPNQCRQM